MLVESCRTVVIEVSRSSRQKLDMILSQPTLTRRCLHLSQALSDDVFSILVFMLAAMPANLIKRYRRAATRSRITKEEPPLMGG